MMGNRPFSCQILPLLVAIALIGMPSPTLAGEAKIAIAANFTKAAKELASRFELETGHKAVLIFGSTGKLYAQIYQSAPFDIFLAADRKRPQIAETEGLAVTGSRFTYAIGKIVLYSTDPDLIDASVLKNGVPEILTSSRFRKLAIGNPKTAPYGMAAKEALTKFGIYNKLKPKIVRGDNIAQTHQFVMTGNAQLGFVAGAQIANNERGSKWIVPDHLYTPIRQDAVLLKKSANNPAAKSFLAFLQSEAARIIIKKNGYDLE